jgi:hypothetical protein
VTAQALWLPGEFPTTNKLLDLTRASGYYAGRRSLTRERPRKNEAGAEVVIARIRADAHMRARAVRLVPPSAPVSLLFVHLGSGRRDPSSWYLSAKAIEDGLVDAGVLGSDRFDVVGTAGRCAKASDPVWQAEVARLCNVETGGREGMFVALGVPDGLAGF